MNYVLNNQTVFVENNNTSGIFRKEKFLQQVSMLSPEHFEMLKMFVKHLSAKSKISFPEKIKRNPFRYFVLPEVLEDCIDDYLDEVIVGSMQICYTPYIEGLEYFFVNLSRIDKGLTLEGMIQEAKRR